MIGQKGLERIPQLRPERAVVHLLACDGDDGEIVGQQAIQHQVIERRDQLPVEEIPGAEDHERARLRPAELRHGLGSAFRSGDRRRGVGRHVVFTACPPNSFRSAAMTLAPNESGWRDRNRARSDRVMTGAGTSRSMASCTVQRPSPESST